MNLPILTLEPARRGERGAGKRLLHDLANRLRRNPSAEVCTLAADMLDAAATAESSGDIARALYLATGHNPRASRLFEARIALEVMIAITQGKNKNPEFTDDAAYKAVAKNLKRHPIPDQPATLSPSRIKAIWLRRRVEVAPGVYVPGMVFPEAGDWSEED